MRPWRPPAKRELPSLKNRVRDRDCVGNRKLPADLCVWPPQVQLLWIVLMKGQACVLASAARFLRDAPAHLEQSFISYRAADLVVKNRLKTADGSQ